MRRETILKLILVLTVGIMLFALPVNVFADDTGFDDFWDDQGGLNDIQPETNTNTNTDTNTNTNTSTETNTNTNTNITTNTNTNTNIPKAGLVEDTMMIVAITVLAITAVFAYKKVNEYQNI